jgi:hypothetical protein
MLLIDLVMMMFSLVASLLRLLCGGVCNVGWRGVGKLLF